MLMKSAIVAALLWGAGVLPVRAQGAASADDLSQLREEVRRLKDELEELRGQVDRLASGAPAAPGTMTPGAQAATAEQVGPALPATIALLPSQVAELAQVKVESASKLLVKLFGTIHSTTFVNSGEANWLENPNIVQPRPAPGGPEGSFSSTMKQTRLGFMVDGLRVGSLRASGELAFDFLGGAPAFQTGTAMGLPRLLYAFARIEGDRTALEVGQDEMVLAPRDPTSLAAFAFPDLFRSGNLYLRVPQIRVEHRLGGDDRSALRLSGALVAPLAGDFTTPQYTFAPQAGTGERSRVPAIQGRLGWSREGGDGVTVLNVGLSGHFGRQRQVEDTRDSWAAAVDVDGEIGRLGFGGDWFTGDRLAAFGGALGQQARSSGGFVEGRFRVVDRLSFTGGFGSDRISRDDWSEVALKENLTGFGNAIYRFTPELVGSMEYRWLETSPVNGARRDNHHVSWVLAFDF